MYYAGAHNNVPQQIGVASSSDGEHWARLSDQPLLENGPPGSWNSSESGHPGILNLGAKTYLFYQGNDDHGKTYHISMTEILWDHGRPHVKQAPLQKMGRLQRHVERVLRMLRFLSLAADEP